MLEDHRIMKETEVEESKKLLEIEKDEKALMELQEEMKVAQDQMVEEPGEEEDCERMKVRMSGGQVERRFRRSDKVKNILDWVVCQGVGRGQFKLLFWPDLDIAQVHEEMEVGVVFSENRVVLVLEMVDMGGEEE